MVLSTQSAQGGLFASQFGAPSAITAPKNTGYVALTGTNPRGGIKGNPGDGDLSFGYALGNPVSGVGVTVGVDVTGLEPFGDSGSFSLTFSRLLHAGQNSVTFGAISGSGIGGWGDQKGNERGSIFFTHMTQLQMGETAVPFMATLGYGQDAKFKGGTGKNRAKKENGVFWAMGVGVTDFMSFSLSGTDNQVNAGVGLRIPGVDGLSVSLGQYDLANKHDRTQTALTVSYAYRFGAK
ncbi:MAG: hypothetical protein N4A61_06390 [Pelagimonas sp.]|nr:hypothetical protein [Pelagimonas sp.]